MVTTEENQVLGLQLAAQDSREMLPPTPEQKWSRNAGGFPDKGVEVTVKLSLLLALCAQRNSISATAAFTLYFTAELSHVSSSDLINNHLLLSLQRKPLR